MSVIRTALLPVREEALQYPADLLSPWTRRLPGTARWTSTVPWRRPLRWS